MVVSVAVAPTNEVLDFLDHDLPNEETEDLESKLLKPVDYEDSTSVMSVQIIRIEGLPDMDYKSILQKNKDAVDPYVKIILGSQKVDNKKWKRSNTANPTFGHQINIPYSHPSVADDLRIEIVDDDPGRDDIIATLRLPITLLAKPFNNEPPPHVNFGPAWLPIYGDVCELNMQVKDKNLAKRYATG